MLLILKNLLENPRLIERIKNEPDKLEDIYTEILRFDSVGKILLRYTREDVELHGVTIPAGAMVFLPAAAANRDPRVFEDPDSIQEDRDLGESMHFGHGIHYCLGAHLARAEITAMVLKFVDLVGTGFEYDGGAVSWRADNFTVRVVPAR